MESPQMPLRTNPGMVQEGSGSRCQKYPVGRSGNDSRPLFLVQIRMEELSCWSVTRWVLRRHQKTEIRMRNQSESSIPMLYFASVTHIKRRVEYNSCWVVNRSVERLKNSIQNPWPFGFPLQISINKSNCLLSVVSHFHIGATCAHL